MKYPTMEEVEVADRMQLATWYRFLKSPGYEAADLRLKEFEKILEKEAKVISRIAERFNEMGGFTPMLSKTIGWEK